ncbi:MAG: T9SS type A sorting domain-containing protein [Chitinophagales bacterium]
MKKLLSVTLIVFYSFSFLSAQIFFRNPSFEGTICTTCAPDSWSYCNFENLVLDSFYAGQLYPGIIPYKGISGSNVLFMEKEYPHDFGGVSQRMGCILNGNVYSYNFFSASLWGPPDSFYSRFSVPGYMTIYLGNDSCDRRQKIYQSPVLDSSWHHITVTFQPDSNYQWISFWPENDSLTKIVDIALDALSPIYLINANAVHVASKDTVVYTQPNEQKCITVKATSTITTYDTVRWYKLVDTVKVPVALGLQASVCVDSNTTFLIGLRDSVMGCAGVEWSWDTLRVWVRDTVLGVREVDAVDAFSLQPNPVVDVLTITPSFEGPYEWTITDALGRLSAKGRGRNTTEVPLDGLSRGAYLLQVEGVVRRFLKE